ncbi:MAG: extracellular solute-binding protein [Rhodospirillales bacterium]|nr:extracellular solute-binding protein [Rhodospirillales bacterium]
MNETTHRISRRSLLGTAAAGLAAPVLVSTSARAAASKRIVVGTWGGDYEHLQDINIVKPILVPKGYDVVWAAANEPPRMAQIIAQRLLPHGTLDVAAVEAPAAFRLDSLGLLEKLDAGKIPNLAHVDPVLRTDFMVPHIYSAQILIYDPKKLKTPPSSFADLMNPAYKGRMGMPTGNYFYIMMAAALYGGGNVDAFDKAKPLMEKVNANGLRLYPETDSIGPAFKSGEIELGLMWLARVAMWQNAGIDVAAAFPKEGSVLYVSGFVVPKNAPNKEGAYAYLDAVLDPSAQRGFAATMGYLPTVDNAPLSGKIGKQLAFPVPKPKLLVPDYAFDVKAQTEISSWWQSHIARG